MHVFFSLLAFVLLPLRVRSGCSNQCSGHGTCGIEDTCNCFPRYGGPDCSKRLCARGLAWVAASSDELTQRMGPAFGSLGGKHAYEECSSKGECDYNTGLCQCYDGFTGVACHRQKCPLSCSGHGRCVTNRQTSSSYSAGNTYASQFWDSQMTRRCDCDRGWEGFACNHRKCPLGSDPLVCKKDEYSHSVQRIRLTNMDFKTPQNDFKVSIVLKFTDMFSGTYSTTPIQIWNKRRPKSEWNSNNQFVTTSSGEPYDVHVLSDPYQDLDANRIRDAIQGLPNFAVPLVNVTDSSENMTVCVDPQSCTSLEMDQKNLETEYWFDVIFVDETNSGRQELMDCVIASEATDHPAVSPRMQAPTIYDNADTTTVHAPGVTGHDAWWSLHSSGPSCTVEHVDLEAGKMERSSEPCSKRGVCDTSTGTCMCFAGYAGEACGIQTIYF